MNNIVKFSTLDEKRNSQFWIRFRQKLEMWRKFWTKLVLLDRQKRHFGQDIFRVHKHAGLTIQKLVEK